jgi:hypothetical protein
MPRFEITYITHPKHHKRDLEETIRRLRKILRRGPQRQTMPFSAPNRKSLERVLKDLGRFATIIDVKRQS